MVFPLMRENAGHASGLQMSLTMLCARISVSEAMFSYANAPKGLGFIRLGFWLNKKPNKTPQEKAAAKAFVKLFWGALGITLLFVAVLFILTGYAMSGADLRYNGIYEESRTGTLENGQVRYVKNELFYLDPKAIGLPADLPDGTHVNLYFDENGAVIAGENADEIDAAIEGRVVLTMVAMGAMVVVLVTFAIVARKTFGKPWYLWLQTGKGAASNKSE